MMVIEQQFMNAVVAMNRKMADQNKPDWEQYRMDTARYAATRFMVERCANCPVEERPTYEEVAQVAVKMADALVAELQKQPLKNNNNGTMD